MIFTLALSTLVVGLFFDTRQDSLCRIELHHDPQRLETKTSGLQSVLDDVP